MAESIVSGKIDTLEYSYNDSSNYMRDLNEERVTFFDKTIETMEQEVSAVTK